LLSHGKLLYETPEETYKSQMNQSMYVIIPVIFYETITILGSFWFITHTLVILYGILLSIILIFTPLLAIFAISNTFITSKLIIYETGFFSPKRPLIKILKREQDYIDFSTIQSIKFKIWGIYCEITLPENKRILLDSSDLDGYLLLCSILIDRFMPIDKRPNLNILREIRILREKRDNGEISNDEVIAKIKQQREVNKEYM
jgi:hypothetical protein